MKNELAKSTLTAVVFTLTMLTLGHTPLFGKEKLPALVLGLNNDTLLGEIKVKNAFDKGKDQTNSYFKNQAYSYLQFSIEFTSKDGQTKDFKPAQIKAFLIWTNDSTFEKYVSARLESPYGLGEEENQFGRRDMGTLFSVGENEAFIRVLNEQGSVKLYAFYEEETLTYSNGPAIYDGLHERFLVRKGNDRFIKLNSKSKRRKAQLLQVLGDCAKIKTVLEKPKLDTGDVQILQAIIVSYNNNCGG